MQSDVVDVWPVQLGRHRRVICLHRGHLLNAADAVLVAAVGADPHWDRGAPVTFATNRPVLDVREPFSHSLAAGPLRSPFDLGVVLQYLVANRGHADKPAVHRIVQ